MGKKKKVVAPVIPAKTEPLSEKAYQQALRKLHVELVKLQRWVVHKGLKVCIVFEGRDGAWAPWFVARSEDKKHVRLNIITHLLSQLPYESLPTEHITLPKRKIGKVKPTHFPFRFIPEKF
ncbi:hypothetical protein [Klebsiella aerogenes]|uniref:hypothetical protein n=1 Tax=Klebsiella aerogenes TaxID=548 RepID=UPI002D800E6E|nr:hypothetical protein [Klebsiella aerogenes]